MMKFALRFLFILVLATFLGFSLYFIVQAIPRGLLSGNSQDQSTEQVSSSNVGVQENQQGEPERRKVDEVNVLDLILGVGKKFIQFAVIATFSVIVHKILSEKRLIGFLKN